MLTPEAGGGLPYETDGDAGRLPEGCKFCDFGLAYGVLGKAPIFYVCMYRI